MIEMPEIRERIRGAVSSLHELDDQLASLAESLALPPDAGEMWDLRTPMSFTANLYAAVDAVRTDCIQNAVVTLLRAVRQSDTSLRCEWALLEAQGLGKGDT